MVAIDLRTLGALKASRIQVYSDRERPEYQPFLAALRDREGRPPITAVVSEEGSGGQDGVLLSSKVLQAMASSLGAA
jgi:hypothetical protein